MDLLQTVRKEGSRGGRGEFKWDDVKGDAHRENYLGHSLMAPVGRWQRNRDLSWYAKGDADPDDPDPERTAALARKEELRKIKEAEEDAMAAALGLPKPVREQSGANAVPVAPREGISDREMRKAVEEGRDDDGDLGTTARGLGRGVGAQDGGREVLEGDVVEGGLRGEKKSRRRSRSWDRERDHDRERERERHRRRRDRNRADDDRRRRRDRSRSRDKDRHRRHRSRSRHEDPDRRKYRSRSRDTRRDEERRRHRTRSRSGSRERYRGHRRRERSNSPGHRESRKRDY